MKPHRDRCLRARVRMPVMTGEHAYFVVESLQAVIDALWHAHEDDLIVYIESAGIPCGRPRGARWSGTEDL
ncbi:MAG: hypothetical protein ACOY3Y_11515 [Acidobacteriota bacterium]